MLENLFLAFNTLALLAWILLIFFKNTKLAEVLLYRHFYLIFLAVAYILFIVWGMAENSGGDGGMDSLASLRVAFLNDKVLLAAWIHYLIFDLFVGIWISKKADQTNMNKVLRAVLLFFTFFFGPVGFLGYKISERFS